MRSPYMDILEKATEQPKTFVLSSSYDASIAATSVKSLARNRDIADINVLKLKNTIIVWRGQLEQIHFQTPQKKLSPYALEKLQVRAALEGMRA